MLEFQIDQLVKMWLEEDINNIDLASSVIFDEEHKSKGKFMAKEDGVICGWDIVRRVFELLKYEGELKVLKSDGASVLKGECIAELYGRTKSLLMGERVALNILSHFSGISTKTNKAVSVLSRGNTKLLDTRKTTPGLRMLEKYAVRTGGGVNHRYNLSQAVMIKDNHIKASGGITNAYDKVKSKSGPMTAIEIEVKNIEELKEAIVLKPNLILLDNMNDNQLRECVDLCNGLVPLEASGNMTLERLDEIKDIGLDYISMGELTHSVKALDISMKLI